MIASDRGGAEIRSFAAKQDGAGQNPSRSSNQGSRYVSTVAIIVTVAGYIVGLIDGICLLIVAFQESIGWGLACLFLPSVSIVFAIMHWDDAKMPFLVSLGGGLAIFVGALLSGTA
jgi:hypothetical protein